MSRAGNFGARLYRGDVSYDFVGRRWLWYGISIAVIVISLISLGARGLHLSIDFKGGAVYSVKAPGASVAQATDALSGVPGVVDPIVQKVGDQTLRIEIGDVASQGSKSDEIKKALGQKLHVAPDNIGAQVVGPSWGNEISQKALLGLLIFLGLVVLYLSIAFEWKMALAAMVALVHDLVITVGVYSLVGFEVSPATVIGVLTILGYSLYDTVVVYDKVKENTRNLAGGARMTYSQAANLAVNQTLIRSINTSLIALLPIAALLFVGAGLLHAGVLKDLALALFIGIAAGTYSSIFIATPLAATLKEREPAMKALARRVAARQQAEGRKKAAPVEPSGQDLDEGQAEPAAVRAGAGAANGAGGSASAGRAQSARPRPKSRNRPSGKKRR